MWQALVSPTVTPILERQFDRGFHARATDRDAIPRLDDSGCHATLAGLRVPMGLNCLTESAADDARRFWDRMAGNCRSSEGALWQEVRDVALRTDGWRETRAAYSLAEVCGLDCARTRYPNSPWHKQVSARQQGELEGFTYDPRSNPLVRHREEVPRRLDHIYIAAGDTSQLSLRVGRDFVGEPLSDHYGVWASLRIARRV